ncbi:MAG: hypothetical protein KG003_13725 [Bacteroidetes bacterium]|nr:hypothetical protein [Bacteroidota bacterium]
MAKEFYKRLLDYYEQVGQVLRGEADSASIFPNSSDIGISRELVYAQFLRQHAPSKCNVFLGGFLFGEDGDESKQLDVIITNDTAPQFNFHNKDEKGKSFGPVEGCLGVASIKSMLDKIQLYDSLLGIASIPETKPLGNRINPMLKYEGYENWPYKIIYASNGISIETIFLHLQQFYIDNPQIPVHRKPDIIHVAGKYVIFRVQKGMTFRNPLNQTTPTASIGDFIKITANPDTQAIVWTFNNLQKNATVASHINFDYSSIINNLYGS